MKHYPILILLLLTFGCKEATHSKKEHKESTNKRNYTVALKFINDYNKEFLNPQTETFEWLSKNKSVTPNFIEQYKQLLDSANTADPELGLDFDPIVNAQDSDEQEFEIKKIDSLDDYVIVKGKSAPSFEITLKVTERNGVSLVDGSGVVNIPISKLTNH